MLLQPKQKHPEGEWQGVSAIIHLETDHLYLTFAEVHKGHKNIKNSLVGPDQWFI